jgi:putative transport protein
LLAGAVTTVAAANVLGIHGPLLSGVYAGALTNTPALAASQQFWDSDLPTVGYSVTYMFGVLGMLFGAMLALKTKPATNEVTFEAPDDAPPKLEGTTVRIDAGNLGTVGSVIEKFDGKMLISRYMRGDSPGHPGEVHIATDDVELLPGDIVTVIGDEEKVAHFVSIAGHRSTVPLTLDRSTLDYRRIAVSNREIAGIALAKLQLDRKFGAIATRVRRGDVDLLATEDLILQIGDRVRVVAPRNRMREVAAFFGDSEKGAQSFSLTALAIGLAAGVFLGLLEFPAPGGGQFALGMAGGPLLMGLILGRIRRTGTMLWSLPPAASITLNHLGMMLFLAYAGSNSGAALADAIVKPTGWRLLVIGVVVTMVAAAIQLSLTRVFGGVYGSRLAGVMAGSQTQPAVLAYANARSSDDPRVNLGYALAYPIAMIAKVLIAPFVGKF